MESIYQKLIDWTEEIAVRREYEFKLLRHAYDTLITCPLHEKREKRGKVWQIASGMVTLNLPDELAWTICVDWKDFELIGVLGPCILADDGVEMYGLVFIEDLIQAIPESGPAKVLSAYIKSQLHKFPPRLPTHSDMNEDEEREAVLAFSEDLHGDMMVQYFSFFLMVERI